MKKNKILIILSAIIYTCTVVIICDIGFSNKYENQLVKLRTENETERINCIDYKLEHPDLGYTIEISENSVTIDGVIYQKQEVENHEE